MSKSEYIKDLVNISVDRYDYADYKHLFKLNKIAMSHVSVKPGEYVPLHVHDNEEQTYWIIKGSGEIKLNDEVYDVKDNQAVYIPLGTKHTIKNTGKGPLKYIYFAAIV